MSKSKNQQKKKKEKTCRKKRKSTINYTNEQLIQALNEIGNGLSLRDAEEKFGIPKSTLHLKLSNKTTIGCKKGPASELKKEEEDHIVNWILESSQRGFPVTKARLIDNVQKYMQKTRKVQENTVFKNFRPGKKWYSNFMSRHPILTTRMAQNLTTTRASVSEDDIRGWFSNIKQYLESKNLINISADRYFNLDESAFQLVPKGDKVIALKGMRNVYQIVSANEKGNVTVLFTASANGKLAPPMVLFDLKTSPKRQTLNHIPSGWGVGNSERGWMTGESFFSFMANIFYPWLLTEKITFPIVLFVDNHSSHVNLDLLDFCTEKQIELVALYPNSTHIIQPLDVAFFRPLKEIYKQQLIQYKIEKNIINFKKYMVAEVLQRTLDAKDFQPSIVEGFKTCGLYPVNADVINYNIFNKKKKNKSSTQTKSTTEDSAPVNKFLELLQLMESNIVPEILNEFLKQENDPFWTGELSQEALFEHWKKIKQLSRNLGVFEERDNMNIYQNDILLSDEMINHNQPRLLSNSFYDPSQNPIELNNNTILSNVDINVNSVPVILLDGLDVNSVMNQQLELIEETENEQRERISILSSSSLENQSLEDSYNGLSHVNIPTDNGTLSEPVSMSENVCMPENNSPDQPLREIQCNNSSNKPTIIMKSNIMIKPSISERLANNNGQSTSINVIEKDCTQITAHSSINGEANTESITEKDTIIKEVFNVQPLNKKPKKFKGESAYVIDHMREVLQKKESEKKAKEKEASQKKNMREKLKNKRTEYENKKTNLREEKKKLQEDIKNTKNEIKKEQNKENIEALNKKLVDLEKKLDENDRSFAQNDIEFAQAKLKIKDEVQEEN